MAREVWVCGEHCVDGCWNFRGVFTRKSKAIHHCEEAIHFVAPVRLNQPLQYGTANWPGIEYPLGEEAVNGSL